jgi:ubiquinone/menaquinone biosynthesis C-methylase UbiE
MPRELGTLDVFHRAAALDPATIGEIAATLETRAQAPEQIAMREAYLDLLEPLAGARVLEVGCGGGPVLRALAPRVGPRGEVVGLDPSVAFLALARQTAMREGLADAITLHAGAAQALPYRDATFDVALAVTTLNHLDEVERAVAEVVRVVRSGGRVGVFENDSESAIVAHPDRALTRRIVAAYADHASMDSWLARRLPGMLAAAGLGEVAIRAFTTLERDPAGWFAHLTAFRAEAAVRVGAITEQERDTWLAALRAQQAAGRFLAGQTSLFVWGKRPADAA